MPCKGLINSTQPQKLFSVMRFHLDYPEDDNYVFEFIQLAEGNLPGPATNFSSNTTTLMYNINSACHITQSQTQETLT